MKNYILLLLLTLLLISCGKNKFKRSDFLQDFYTQKIWPDLLDTESKIEQLKTVYATFKADPSAAKLEDFRAGFKTTLTSFEKISFYNLGDISAISVYNAAYKTSIDTSVIWDHYAATNSFSADLVATYGNKQKGIYTLEYLLFFEDASDSLSSSKYQSFIDAHLQTLHDNFLLIKNSWDTYETNFVSQEDEGVEGSYNIVINRIVHLLEDLIDKRINVPLDAADAKMAVGYWSVSAWSNIKTQVSQLNAIYNGNGTESFNSVFNSVRKKNKKLAEEIQQKFETLIEMGNAMTADMQYYVTTGSSELVQYKERLKELLVLFKLDVVEELDIVLTFGDNDGD